MPGIGIRIGKLGFGGSSSSSWTPLILVVENAEPTKVVMAGSASNTNAVAGDFTITGFTVSSLARDVTNKILTLTLSTSVPFYSILNVVFGGISYSVTNNVQAVEQTANVGIKMLADGITAGYIGALNKLSGFNDLSGNNNNGARVQISDGTHPELIMNAFGTHKAVRLKGLNTSYFSFAEITNARSFIWIGKEDIATSPLVAPILGSTATYYQYSRGQAAYNDRGIFYYSAVTTNYKWTRQQVRVNGKLINPHGTSVPTEVKIICGVNDIEDTRLDCLAVDRVPSRIFGGDILLFKIFSDRLTDIQMRNEVGYWSAQLGISINWSGVPNKVQYEGDSMAFFATSPFAIDKAPNMPVSATTSSSASGSKVSTMSARSDANTIPNEPRTDFFIQCGINNCNAYYNNSAAQQRADFAAELSVFYSKIMAKNNPTHIFWGNLPVCDARATQAIEDAVPFHYIYNEELDALAAAHANVHIIDIASVIDGTIADDLSADGFHPSAAGYAKMQIAYLAVVNEIYT